MPSNLVHQLGGIQAKLDFAHECVDTLNGEWHGQHIKAIRIAFEYDPETEWHTAYLTGIHDMPRLCVLTGAAAGQARAALDHTVRVLVKRNHKKPTKHHSFPIWESGNPEAFIRETRRPTEKTERGKRPHGKLYGVRKSTVALIEQFQPYRSPDGPDGTPLYGLDTLAKKDRHQTLTETLTWMSPADIRPLFVAPDGCEIVGYRNLLRDPTLNRVIEGTKLARIRMVPPEREPEVDMERELPLNIAFGYGTNFQSINALKDIVRGVGAIIDVLDTFGRIGGVRVSGGAMRPHSN